MRDNIPTLIHGSDRPALLDLAAGWELSGAGLRAAVDRLAGQLAAAGAGPGEGVGIAMPNSGETVLAFWTPKVGPSHAGCFGVAQYHPGVWHDPEDDDDFYADPTHWMPLPEPPKGESK